LERLSGSYKIHCNHLIEGKNGFIKSRDSIIIHDVKIGL